MKILQILLLSLVLTALSYSQSVSVYDINTSKFPTLKAKIAAFDINNLFVEPNIKDLKLTENGIQRKITFLNCPKKTNDIALSTVLIMDVSGSMESGRGSVANIDLAKIAAESWIKALPLGNSECALTSFDNSNSLVQDFTTNRTKLLNSVQLLKPNGGTDYESALINKIAGGLQISLKGQYKKVIVLLSDGMPNFEPNTSKIIKEAKAQGCVIFCVTLGMPAPNCMKEMSAQTGGKYFENVTSLKEARDVYNNLLNLSLNNNPCTIEWESETYCSNNDVNVELTWLKDTSRVTYSLPANGITSLKIEPSYIYFGLLEANKAKDTTIKITAVNSNYNITEIISNDSNGIFSILNATLPIYLQKGESKNIVLRVLPVDSNLNFNYYSIKTDKCEAFLSCAEGQIQSKIRKPFLQITSPNGGENFVMGNDTVITWKGVSPSDTISINYSLDLGLTWKNITKKAVGLSFKWNSNILAYKQTNKILLQVNKNLKNNNENDTSLTIKSYVNDSISIIYYSVNNDGTILYGVANNTKSNKYSIAVYNVITKQLMYSKESHNSYITKVLLNSTEDYLFTSSYDNTIKKWNTKNGELVHTFLGHTQAVNDIKIDENDNIMVSTAFDSTIIAWDLIKEEPIKIIKNQFKCYNIDFNIEKNIIVATNYDKRGSIYVCDIFTNIKSTSFIGNYNLSSLYLNKNSDKIIVGGYDSSIVLVDINTGDIDYTFRPYESYSSYYSKEYNLLIAQKFNSDLQIIQPETGIVLNSFNEYNGSRINSSYMNKSGTYIISNCYSNNYNISKLWKIEPNRNINSDTTDNYLNIINPNIITNNIDIGKVEIGNYKDTIINSSIYNPNDYEVKLLNYSINTNNNSLQIVSGFPNVIIPPKSYHKIEYRFYPKVVGKQNAQVYFNSIGKSFSQSIFGEGISPVISLADANKIVDFGKVRVGNKKDSSQIITITNLSNSPINFDGISSTGPNTTDFTITSSTNSFTLQSNETKFINISFNAKSKGRTSGRIEFRYNNGASTQTIQLFAEGVFEDDVCQGKGFSYPMFYPTNPLLKLGSAKITNQNTLQLTDAKANEFGGICLVDKVSLQSSFVMKFAFKLANGYNSFDDGSLPGADGLAILFQNGKKFNIAETGGGLGYSGLSNCVALEIDLYNNKSDNNDPNGNHVALQIPYQDVISAEHSINRTLKMNDSLFTIRSDGKIYYALLRYNADKSKLEFYLDSNKNYENLVLSADNFNFNKYLTLAQGEFSFIGLTSTTGASAQVHELLSWEFCSDKNEILGLENEYYESEEVIFEDTSISLIENKIKHLKVIDYTGKTIVNDDTDTKAIDLSNYKLLKGVYFVIITDDIGRNYFKKININK